MRRILVPTFLIAAGALAWAGPAEPQTPSQAPIPPLPGYGTRPQAPPAETAEPAPPPVPARRAGAEARAAEAAAPEPAPASITASGAPVVPAPAAVVPLPGPPSAAKILPVTRLRPPKAPAHARRRVETATELARDLAEVVTFLEQGQAYFRAFRKGTHTLEENEELVGFLKDYDKELEIARKEVDALRSWVFKKGALQ